MGSVYCKCSNSSNFKIEKCYVLLITCISTQTVHVKVTANVNPLTLILALCHFIARKGLPKLIVCDDFKTFKAKLIKAFCRSNGICWKFILDQSSWWSGFYEHLIASVKISLKNTW